MWKLLMSNDTMDFAHFEILHQKDVYSFIIYENRGFDHKTETKSAPTLPSVTHGARFYSKRKTKIQLGHFDGTTPIWKGLSEVVV